MIEWKWKEREFAEFWAFVAERHEVFRRRVLEKKPPPWTNDWILIEVAFTNIYRELDRTTRILLNSVPQTASNEDLLFNIIKFRFFTWPPTYWAMGGFRPAKEWPWFNSKRLINLLIRRQKIGHQIFTGAFMVNAAADKSGPGGKVRLVMKRLSWVWKNLKDLASVFYTTEMEEAHDVLLNIPGFGGFMAYEVLTDLTYFPGRVGFDRNQWVFVGPGAIKGLLELVEPVKINQKTGAAMIAQLRDLQNVGLRSAQRVLNGPTLTLENVEQALCEFQKYKRYQRGGRTKRRYDPAKADRDLGVWKDLPLEFLG